MLNVLTIVASALLSGLIATWVTLGFTERNQRRRAKFDLFQQLVGTRNVLLPTPHDSTAATAFISSVNQIFLLFHDAPDVLVALKAFHEIISDLNGSPELRNQRLLELFKSMAKHLNVSTEPMGEGFFMKAFSVNSLASAQPLNLDVHGLECMTGAPYYLGPRVSIPGSAMPFFMPTDVLGLIGAMFMEFASIARERDAALRSMGSIDLGSVPDLAERLERRRKLNE